MSLNDRAREAASEAAAGDAQSARNADARIRQFILAGATRWFVAVGVPAEPITYHGYASSEGKYDDDLQQTVRLVNFAHATWAVEGYEYRYWANGSHRNGGEIHEGGVEIKTGDGMWRFASTLEDIGKALSAEEQHRKQFT